MPKRYSGKVVARPEGRTGKILRVLEMLREHGCAPGHRPAGMAPLSRQRLAELADVTVRNLDAIIACLRQQGYGIVYDDGVGYYLKEEEQTGLPCVRTPAHFETLRALRRYLERAGTTVDHDRWLALIDQLIRTSEQNRQRTMGRGFAEARVDEQGVIYRVDEPMIFYLSVHRAAPDPVTRANIGRLKQAIASHVAVRLKYVNRAGERDTIVVEPYFIFEREGTYYLAGLQVADGNGPMKRSRFKPFTLTKVRCPSLDLLPDHPFEPRRCYSPEQCLTVTGIGNGRASERITAEIDVFGRFAYNVCETLHGEDSVCTWISTAPGRQQVRIKATFGSRYDLMRYVLSFGEHACLVSPPDVRAMIAENIAGMIARYSVPVAQESVAPIIPFMTTNVVNRRGVMKAPGINMNLASQFNAGIWPSDQPLNGETASVSVSGTTAAEPAERAIDAAPDRPASQVETPAVPRRRGRPRTRNRPEA